MDRKVNGICFRLWSRVLLAVPVRKGNGFMDQLEKDGFKAPNITSLECVLESGLSMGRGRVFVDLWDSQAFEGCSSCKSLRLQRIMEMNEYQSFQPEVQCHECLVVNT